MAKRGVPIHEVAYMLGHESIHTTKKYYTEVRVDNLREKINSINGSK
jgi:site-specific recombinase XerD